MIYSFPPRRNTNTTLSEQKSGVFLMKGKVEICGVNTAKLTVYSDSGLFFAFRLYAEVMPSCKPHIMLRSIESTDLLSPLAEIKKFSKDNHYFLLLTVM